MTAQSLRIEKRDENVHVVVRLGIFAELPACSGNVKGAKKSFRALQGES
jgi:hypothetical protein